MDMLAFSVTPAGVGNLTQFWIVGVLAVMVVGAAKGGFAGGLGLLSMPLMILACGHNSQLALALMLPLLIASDWITLLLWWRQWDTRNILLMLPGMLTGVALGGGTIWLFRHFGGGSAGQEVSSAILGIAIGLLAVGFVILHAVQSVRGELHVFRPVFWHGCVAGVAAGFASTLGHAAGPITNMYFLSQQMPKRKFVATSVLYYWVNNQVKLIPYWLMGMLTVPDMTTSVALMPAAVVGALLGVFLHNRVNARAFAIIIHGLLALAGVYLCVDGVIRLWPK
jgi:uncharacterized membrane protein YfcA